MKKSSETKHIVSVTDLSVNYERNTILKSVSVKIAARSFNLFIGGNGSGKSTFVKAILGLVDSTSKNIQILGQQWTRNIVAKTFGYVPQFASVDRDFPISVREIIDLACLNRSKCNMNPEEHLDYLGASYLVDRKLNELSGGELQKVLVARSLVNNPEILILDEPTNNLDRETQTRLFKLLIRLNNQGKTIILISHDHNLIDEVSAPHIYEFIDKKIVKRLHSEVHSH